MKVKTQEEAHYCLVEIEGEVDASSSIGLDEALHEALGHQSKKVLVNCEKLHYISSAGIGVFTSRVEDCEKNGTSLLLFGMNTNAYNVFKILGLHQLLPIVNTKEDAIKRSNDL